MVSNPTVSFLASQSFLSALGKKPRKISGMDRTEKLD